MSEPTIGVCGFGRCGSTMLMRMLDVGGVPTLGESGTYELEDNLAATVAKQDLAGRAVKLLDLVLHEPIPPARWKFVWMDRDAEQQAKSTVKFMRGIVGIEPGPFARHTLVKSFGVDRDRAVNRLQEIAGVDVFVASFEDFLRQPRWHAEQLARFLAPDFGFDWEAAAAVVHERTAECRPDLAFELQRVVKKQWPDETPEQVIEAIRRADGDEAAALAAKAMGWEPPAGPRRAPKRVVGEKERPIVAQRPYVAKGAHVVRPIKGKDRRRRMIS